MAWARRFIAALIAGSGALGLPAVAEAPAPPQSNAQVIGAAYADPTTRYAHGVLGDAVEWGSLILWVDTCIDCARQRIEQRKLTLPATRVFEDIAPRLITLDVDGQMAAMVVESHADRGARLALYGATGLIATTPFIGQRHRWLAPIGAGDLDGDGKVEIAYIDRPHLAKRLRVWRFEGGALHHVADLDGLTNHRIGWDFIAGGLRDCGQGPEMITANADWTRIMATRLAEGALSARDIGAFTGPKGLSTAITCN